MKKIYANFRSEKPSSLQKILKFKIEKSRYFLHLRTKRNSNVKQMSIRYPLINHKSMYRGIDKKLILVYVHINTCNFFSYAVFRCDIPISRLFKEKWHRIKQTRERYHFPPIKFTRPVLPISLHQNYFFENQQ